MKKVSIIVWLGFAGFVLHSAGTIAYADGLIKDMSLGYQKLDQTAEDDPTRYSVTKTLTAKYSFNQGKEVKPYIGTGLAYTQLPDIKPGENSKINAGVAAQAGLMIQIDKNAFFNIDYKYLHLTPETAREDNKVRPQSFGFGLNIKF
jgi:outer membrane protein W